MPRATLALLLAASTLACRPQGSSAPPPDTGPVAWIDADPLAPAEIPAKTAGARAGVARID